VSKINTIELICVNPLPSPHKSERCEGKWQEMLLADDARRSAIGQKRRIGGENPTSAERAGEMISTLRESRKAEIRNLLTIVAGDNAQADKDIANAAAADHATLERFVAEASKHPDLALISSVKTEASAMPHNQQQQTAQQAPAQQHQDAHRPAAAQPADHLSAASASAAATAAAAAASAAPASDRRHSVSTKAAHDATPVQHASKQKGAAGASVPASRTAAPAAAAPAEDEEVRIACPLTHQFLYQRAMARKSHFIARVLLDEKCRLP